MNRAVFLAGPKSAKSAKPKKATLTKARVEACRKADSIVNRAVLEEKLQMEIWQFPVILLPLDFGGKGEAIVLRPVQSKEAMTAEFYKMEPETLGEISKHVKKVKGVGAVLYDITNKPPATIEWE